MRLFSNLFFIETRPRFSQETKGFACIEDSLGFSALCDLPETFFEKNRFFFRGFRLSKMGFCCFQLGEKCFSSLMRIPLRVCFGTVKFMFKKILKLDRGLGPFPAC